MLTLEEAREVLRLDNADNDDIIAGLLEAIPDYIELSTGLTPIQQAAQPLADTASRFILLLWYNAERADSDRLQRTIGSLLSSLALIALRGE